MGFRHLRHGLGKRLVNKAEENPRTAQDILAHSRIETILDLYTDEDLDEMIAAQDGFWKPWDSNRRTISRSCRWD